MDTPSGMSTVAPARRFGVSRTALRRTVLSLVGAGARLAAKRAPGGVPARPRLLLIRPDHVGDVILTSPAVEVLRKALPEAYVAMMVGPWSREAARGDPLLDEVLVCPFPGFARAPKSSLLAPYRLLWQTAADLRAHRFDAALVLRFDHWWGAWMAALARIPMRVGFATHEVSPFLTHALAPPAPTDHWTDRALAVTARLLEAWHLAVPRHPFPPPLRFQVTEDDEDEADRLFAAVGIEPDASVVALHPGSGSPLKLWIEERWVAVGRIMADGGHRVVVTGSPHEATMAERIVVNIPGAASLAGKTDLDALAAVLRRCRLVVGCDSGALHLAVAVGVPTVHLFGPVDPAVYGPWGSPQRHRVVTGGLPGSPCGRLDLRTPDGSVAQCMAAISVEQVLAACEAATAAANG